jgi:tellurite resistance protein TehA-like permease
VLPEDLQASGMGILVTVVSIGNLLSSVLFGALWVAIGLQQAVIVFAVALAVALAVAAPLLLRSQRAALHG